MIMHTDTAFVVRERLASRVVRNADAQLETIAPAALSTWLEYHGFPDPHSRCVNGETPLMRAAQHGEDAVVEALLELGARADALDDDGNHALWFACLHGGPATILRLIDAGAPIDYVKRRRHHMPDAGSRERSPRRPAHAACAWGERRTVRTGWPQRARHGSRPRAATAACFRMTGFVSES
ncbi:ankyrin repeat domain-containing protein [Paraburkholderia sprentiae]